MTFRIGLPDLVQICHENADDDEFTGKRIITGLASGRRWTALLGGIGSPRVPNRILQWRGLNEPVFSQGPQNSQPIEIQDPPGRNIPSKWSV